MYFLVFFFKDCKHPCFQQDSGVLRLAPVTNLNLKRKHVPRVRESERRIKKGEPLRRPSDGGRSGEGGPLSNEAPTALLSRHLESSCLRQPFLFLGGVPGQSLRVTAGVPLSCPFQPLVQGKQE